MSNPSCSSSSLARNTALPRSDSSLSEKLKTALNGLNRPAESTPGVSIKIAKEPEKEEISEAEKNLKLTLDLLNSVNNLENLTPAQAADVLKVFQSTQSVGDTSPAGVNGDEEFNMCPAWGCKRKFQVTTNGGKSNISSLWIHMQNAHKAAFVVFRRLKRQGYDKYCDKCQFWLKVG